MNPLLFIAKITKFYRLRRWLAVKRYKQWQAHWAKEKATSAKVAVESLN
jgi:hypothetical protein